MDCNIKSMWVPKGGPASPPAEAGPHPLAHFAKEPALSTVEGVGFHNASPQKNPIVILTAAERFARESFCGVEGSLLHRPSICKRDADITRSGNC